MRRVCFGRSCIFGSLVDCIFVRLFKFYFFFIVNGGGEARGGI